MKNQREIYEALLAGKILQGERLPHRAAMLTDGSIAITKDYGRSWDTLIGGLPEHHTYWSLREEPKNPRVAEAWQHRNGGDVLFAVAGSNYSETLSRSGTYERCPRFDIVEKSE